MEALGHLIEQEKGTIRIKWEEVKLSIYVVQENLQISIDNRI